MLWTSLPQRPGNRAALYSRSINRATTHVIGQKNKSIMSNKCKWCSNNSHRTKKPVRSNTCLYSSASQLNMRRHTQHEIIIKVPITVDSTDFSYTKRRDGLWGPPSHPLSGYRYSFPWVKLLGLMLTTHLCLKQSFRMSAVVLIFPLHAFKAWRTQPYLLLHRENSLD